MNTTLKQRAYEHIRQKLISGRLPPGSRLCNRELAEEIGISFIPVREAINQLTSAGLAEYKPRLGAFVMEPSREEIEELYDIREALECHAVGKAAGRIRDARLTEMQKYNDQQAAVVRELNDAASLKWDIGQIDRFNLADAGFHITLLRAAGNHRALKIVNDLRVMAHVFGHRNEDRPLDGLGSICEEHGRLVEALRRGDADEAKLVMIEHLRRGLHNALEAYDRHRFGELTGRSTSISYPADLQDRIHQMEQNGTSSDAGELAPPKAKEQTS